MATLAPDLARYSRVAVWLHWLIAALIALNLVLGFFHEDFEKPVRAAMMNVHKATGFTILLLTLARLGWRLGHRPPAFDAVLKPWEAGLARLIHGLFYLLLIVLPLSGWILVSTSGRVTSFFGLFGIAPLPVSRAKDVHELFEETHELLAYAALALIALHVAGALKHHLEGHRHLIGRMAPWLSRTDPAARRGDPRS
jgi:cytochrome b561